MTARHAIDYDALLARQPFGPRNAGIVAVFDNATVDAVARVVDQSGVPAQLAAWAATDAQSQHAGGRPATVSARTILCALLLAGLDDRALLVTRVTDIIVNKLTVTGQQAIGYSPGLPGTTAPYVRVWRAVRRTLAVIDAYPTPHHRRLTAAEYADVIASRDPAVCAEKKRRADWVANQLLEATVALIPRDVRRRMNGSVCIDATLVVAHARGTRRSSAVMSIEPEAGWYVREGDHRDPGDESGRKVRKVAWGYEATLAVATPEPGTDSHPAITTGIGFDKPGVGLAGNAIRILASAINRGHQPGWLATDRAYYPNLTPDTFQLPAAALGYKPVMDYRDDQLGIQGHHDGALLIEGN